MIERGVHNPARGVTATMLRDAGAGHPRYRSTSGNATFSTSSMVRT